MDNSAAGQQSSSPPSSSTNNNWVWKRINDLNWAGPVIDLSAVPDELIPGIAAAILALGQPTQQAVTPAVTATQHIGGNTQAVATSMQPQLPQPPVLPDPWAVPPSQSVLDSIGSIPNPDDDETSLEQWLEETAKDLADRFSTNNPAHAPTRPTVRTPPSSTPQYFGENTTPSSFPATRSSSFSPPSSQPTSTPPTSTLPLPQSTTTSTSKYTSGLPRNAWTSAEINACIAHYLAAHTEGTGGEARFGVASERLKSQGFMRTPASVKAMWNRVCRDKSGFDERRKKNIRDADTGKVVGKKPLSTSRQLRKGEVGYEEMVRRREEGRKRKELKEVMERWRSVRDPLRGVKRKRGGGGDDDDGDDDDDFMGAGSAFVAGVGAGVGGGGFAATAKRVRA